MEHLDLKRILLPEVQEYITSNLEKKVNDLAFQKNPFEGKISWNTLLQQIHAKQKAKNKLPTWYNAANIIFPSTISVEQTSSEQTAKFKSSIIQGETLIDLTGGFGVDDYYFAQRFKKVWHCELNPLLSAIVAHNYKQLGISNIYCHEGDSSSTLHELQQKFDWIYLDPARRDDALQKVFLLEDCTPDIIKNQDNYFQYAEQILMKTSPLLDLNLGVKSLKGVKHIHIVAVKNEVKELLWILEYDYNGSVSVFAHNITEDQVYTFKGDLHDDTNTTYHEPLKYLYEPNAAIMKSGLFNAVGNQYNLKKLATHSHLYTSEALIENFPGRTFIIQEIISNNKQGLQQIKAIKQANITTRNYPDTVATIRKKTKIKEGGDSYLFFTTLNNDERIIIVCKKPDLS